MLSNNGSYVPYGYDRVNRNSAQPYAIAVRFIRSGRSRSSRYYRVAATLATGGVLFHTLDDAQSFCCHTNVPHGCAGLHTYARIHSVYKIIRMPLLFSRPTGRAHRIAY